MPRGSRNKGDDSSQFLLPFEEVPRCFTSGKGRSTIDSSEEQDPMSTDDVEKQAKREYFDSFTLERTTDKLMPDGPTKENHSGKFLIKTGQHVLLRPEENSLRPGIGKVMTVFKETGKEDVAIRVRWYYRAEDLTEGPSEAVGEDEVFETQHFDDIDTASVAGRCQVMAYRDWIVLADAKRRSSTPLKAKYAATLRRDNIASQAQAKSDGHGKGKPAKMESEDIMRYRTALQAKFAEAVRRDNLLSEVEGKSDDGKYDREDEDVMDVDIEEDSSPRDDADKIHNGSRSGSRDNEVDSVDKPPSTARGAEVGVDSEDDDIMTVFRANYPDSSVLYYCRRFYDPLSNTFLVSKHEDDDADPMEEIIALRSGREQENNKADDDFREDEIGHSSSDEDYDIAVSADDPEWGNGRPKRKRTSGGQKPVRKRERAPGASQFSLPQDIGVPSTLPCRDSQKAHVQKFLLGAIKGSATDGQGGSRCLYISGVPGTGKTATVREVLRDLITKRSNGNLPPFEVVEVNAMSLPDPNLVYAELYAALTGNRNVTPMHAAHLLEKRFTADGGNSSRKSKRARGGPHGGRQDSCTILILDEMDVLLARKQKVLYDMLEWPTRKNARMAVIGIANTMDLPERILPRIGSRLGLNRLSYPPYTSSQLQTILELTLDETRVEFSKSAIQLCVKKVGSVSGDVRRALELCRRACEILLDSHTEGEKPVVTAPQMQAAIQDIAGGARLVALNQLSLFEKLVLGSAISLARREGSSAVEKTCSMAAVTSEAVRLATTKRLVDDVDAPSTQDLEEACWRLAASRIVIIEATAVPRNSRIIVNVSAEDCLFALRECNVMTALLDGSEPS